MARRLLPIGIQNFRTLRSRKFYYVDKTAFALRLVEEGDYYFLSRPRRFGKSLFLDTLKELFEGSRELFEGLAIYDQWDWSVRHPVVRLDFCDGDFMEPGGLQASLSEQLGTLERTTLTERYADTATGRLRDLLRALHRRAGQPVVLLVDEYDKPILDAMSEPGLARANRRALRALYSVVKSCSAHVRFFLLAGVSKFSKANLFSGLNNLVDITLEPSYSAICGYSENDLDTVFAPEMGGLDREQIRDWYNGYSWGGAERVYNPFDLLLLFRKRVFKPWWFETGTPTFLVETLVRRHVPSPNLDRMVATDELLSTFDVDDIATEALLFQTGYLTVMDCEERSGNWFYRLGYPNREVRQSLNKSLLGYLVRDRSKQVANSALLFDLLQAADITGLEALFHSFFSSIPCEWHTGNEIAHYEGYYASVFYSYFAALGLDITVEESTSAGRLDMAVRSAGQVFLFEFKILEKAGTGAAMAQLKAKGYAEKYRQLGVPVHLVGVEFSLETRNVAGFNAERA